MEVASQSYAVEAGVIRVTVTILSTVVPSVLDFALVARASGHAINPVLVRTQLVEPRGPQLAGDSGTTASTKQGASATLMLQFDKVVASALLGGQPLPAGSEIRGSLLLLSMPAATQV